MALAGSFELLMTLIRASRSTSADPSPTIPANPPTPIADADAPPALTEASIIERTIRTWHANGLSQRAIARELNIDRSKVKRIIDHPG